MIERFKVKPPSRQHTFALFRDLFGNTQVAYRGHGWMVCIYGMFKGRELRGAFFDMVYSWHTEGERVPFWGHPIHGNIILIMGHPVIEIKGPEADEECSKLEKEDEDDE